MFQNFQLELVLIVEKLQELRSIRIQKMKKQGMSLHIILSLLMSFNKKKKIIPSFLGCSESSGTKLFGAWFIYLFIFLVKLVTGKLFWRNTLQN